MEPELIGLGSMDVHWMIELVSQSSFMTEGVSSATGKMVGRVQSLRPRELGRNPLRAV